MPIGNTKLHYITDAIASGTTSAVIDLKGGTLVGIKTPASIASSSFTITASEVSDGTYVTVKNPVDGVAYTATIAASGWYHIPPTTTASLRYIKFVYGSSETAKTFTYLYRSID